MREAIDKGEIAGSVYQNIEVQQILGFNLALNLIAGKKPNDGMEDMHLVGNKFVIPFEIVTKENVDKYLGK